MSDFHQSNTLPLVLVQEIPLDCSSSDGSSAATGGRIDHGTIDETNKLLFVSCLASNCVKVVDLFAGIVICTITDSLSRPSGMVFVPKTGTLYVSNAGNDSITSYRPADTDTAAGDRRSFVLADLLREFTDPDNLRYDIVSDLVYVGHDCGKITSINTNHKYVERQLVAEFEGHPEAFVVDNTSETIFVNVPQQRKVLVIDIKGRSVSRSIDLPVGYTMNFALALDMYHKLLFASCRAPARCAVLCCETGKLVADEPTAVDVDDVIYEPNSRSVYFIGGEGTISCLRQSSREVYSAPVSPPVRTSVGCRTGVFSVNRNRIFAFVPATTAAAARVLCYEPQGEPSGTEAASSMYY